MLMNHKVTPLLLLSILNVSTSSVLAANKTDTSVAEKAFDYSTCATFFAVLASNMGDNVMSSARFKRMSEQMLDHAISMDSDGYKGINEDDVAKKLQEEMQKDEESAKRVIRLYAPHCQKLLQAINEKPVTAVPETPEKEIDKK